MSEESQKPEGFRRFPHLPSKGVHIVAWDNLDRSKLPNFNARPIWPMRDVLEDGTETPEPDPPKP